MIRLIRFLAPQIAVAVLAADAFTGCKSAPRNAFPSSGDVAGWQKTTDTRVFAAQDLWQYICGDSEQYVQTGVVSRFAYAQGVAFRKGPFLVRIVAYQPLPDAP